MGLTVCSCLCAPCPVHARSIPCCVYQMKGWSAAYAFFCAVFILWTASLILEVKLFTVADTIAQWYFSAPTTGRLGPGGGLEK